MKRRRLIAIVLALLLSCIMPASAFATETEPMIERNPFEYAVTPDDARWQEFETYEEMLAAVDIPQEKLDKMTSEELAQAVLDFPLLVNLYLFSSYEEGIKSVREASDAYNELLKRNDGADALANALSASSSKSRNADEFQSTSIALLLTENSMFTKLSPDKQTVIVDQLESVDVNVIVNQSTTFATAALAVYTPNGSYVSVFSPAEGTTSQLLNITNQVTTAYPSATYVSLSSLRYNCHSYAWYNQSTTNPYWMNEPAPYMYDGSYRRTTSYVSCIGARVFYSNTNHTAIVTGTAGPISESGLGNLTVISKWGQGPVMTHRAGYGPYGSSGLQVWIR